MMIRMYCLLAAAAVAVAAPAPSLVPVELTCEYDAKPLGVHAAQPHLGWQVKAVDTQARGLRQTAYRILVSSASKARGEMWDSGKVMSSETAHIRYAGKPLASGATYYWSVRVWDGAGVPSAWSPPSEWMMGLLRVEDWKAKWIAMQPDGEQPEVRMPLFRRAFTLDKKARYAVLRVSGLGQYEARLNGTKVGEGVLQPGWTNYRKTVLYNTYDVTAMVKRGPNAIGVMLGNGMYHVLKTPGRYTKFTGTFGQPKMIAQLHVEYADGSSINLVTDSSWKTRTGPIVYSATFGGEDFDARLEPEGWDGAGFSEREWTQAREVQGPGGTLLAQTNPESRVMESFKPVKVSTPKPGVMVYDLGQNFSGWPRIAVKGPAGSTVKVLCGELLDKEGLVSQASSGGNDRNGRHWYAYTLKGSGVEAWEPRFSYYGFRYVQVEPSEGKPEVVSMEGRFVHAAAAQAGTFACSKPLFNQIHTMINAAVKSNMQSVMTDCPHREKLGWLEETHLLGSAIMFNYDVRRLYGKIAGDVRDAQTADGLVPDIAPEFVVFKGGFRDSPEWGSAAVLNPWLVYQHHGDRRMLSEQYDVMKRYAGYLASKSKGHIVSHGLGDWYDIGPKGPGQSQLTSMGLTATAIYYADLATLEKAARLLDRAEEAKQFSERAAEVRAAFNAALYDAKTGAYDRASQTAYAMPLVLGLVAEENRKAVLDKLVENIRANGNRVTAGDVGFHYVVQALTEGGRSDVMYDMLARTDGPSYGYQLRAGATTLTEAWDANPASSQNHFMLGHAEEWFYRGLAGLDIDFSRGSEDRIRIRPAVVGDITSASATHRSIFGEIASSWRIEGGTLQLKVTVPANTRAQIHVPAASADAVRAEVPASRYSDGAAVYNVGSGVYEFGVRR